MSDFDTLQSLLKSNDWPAAAESYMICNPNSETDKVSRADAILEIIVNQPLKGIKFLDFGCGEGYVAKAASNSCSAVGFDIKEYVWDQSKAFFTTTWDEVKNRGPYDAILAYDVLDHADSPEQCMSNIRAVLAPGGKVYIRCHPWTSKHATHLYYTLNKAYLHLVFSDEELAQLGCTNMETQRVIHPINIYKSWLAGFNISEHHVVEEPVAPFFSQQPLIASRIKVNWKASSSPSLASGSKFPDFQLRQQFHDFVLS